jgi:protein ImuB
VRVFAVLQASPSVPVATLVDVAQAFTPRFQVIGPFVLLDLSGLSSLFGSPDELGAALQAQQPECQAMALATTASAAMLLACGRDGLTVIDASEEATALAALSIDVLFDVAQARLPAPDAPDVVTPRTRDQGPGVPVASTGWRHPRDTHQAQQTRRARPGPISATSHRQARLAMQQCITTLRRWGIRNLGALAALPRAQVHERRGELGVSWQRLACGEDDEPLVPWLAEPVFEETLDLEWPVEGFEPLSFVLARLFEPLAARLELADRGAVAIRTALHLTTRAVHLRVLPLPAPMRDPKTLRTLVLLDLESHPAEAPIDRVQVRLEPTPGRVLQWTLFERAQPAPEQVATLIARLTALVGDSHVGAPVLVDSWKPGAFAMGEFQAGKDARERSGVGDVARGERGRGAEGGHPGDGLAGVVPDRSAHAALAFRRFRLPIPVRVRVDEGRPARLTTDRHGIGGGVIVQAAGPWRTSGEWWATDPTGEPGRVGRSSAWDRDEWDIAMADGTVYRLFVERPVGQWYLEGVID